MSLLSEWRVERRDHPLVGRGRRELLEQPLTAFFASRQCPGAAIRLALDWAVSAAKAKSVVVSGFHSPLEQSVLKIFLAANAPAVMVLARDAATAKLSPEHISALAGGLLAVVSDGTAKENQRITEHRAHDRNELVAAISDSLVIAYASPVGQLAAHASGWEAAGKNVVWLEQTLAQ